MDTCIRARDDRENPPGVPISPGRLRTNPIKIICSKILKLLKISLDGEHCILYNTGSTWKLEGKSKSRIKIEEPPTSGGMTPIGPNGPYLNSGTLFFSFDLPPRLAT